LMLVVRMLEGLRVRLLREVGRGVGGIGDVDERHREEGREVLLSSSGRRGDGFDGLRWWKSGRRRGISSKVFIGIRK